jgi:serine/threonine-protein kinase
MEPQRFGRYEILQELGRGGMATVYLAFDPAFGRQVAVKVLPAQFTHDPKFRARFLREAKVIATLENPYIVPVYDYGEEGDHPFIVMRYMPGGTLYDRIAAGPMKLAESYPIVRRMAQALDEAHKHNIVHRDLKPSNVLFDVRNEAFLSDFGLAKLSESSTKLTFTGVMVGTPDYMSPEQAIGEEDIDWRSDIYSLGVILYEMLSGHLPYEAGTPMKLLFKHVNEPVPQLDLDKLGLPAECNAIIASAMAKNPEDRYRSAGMVAEVMRSLLTGVPPKVSPPPIRVPAPGNGGAARHAAAIAPPAAPRQAAQNVFKAAALPTRRGWNLAPWMYAAIGLPVITGLVGVAILWVMYSNGGGGSVPTLAPTATATARATALPALALTASAAPSSTPEPTRTPNIIVITPTPTITDTPTDTLTPSATATRTPRRLPTFTRTLPPANTPTLGPTAPSPVPTSGGGGPAAPQLSPTPTPVDPLAETLNP